MSYRPKRGVMYWRKLPSSACCSCIYRVGSRRCGAIWHEIIAQAASVGLYSNLITAGVLLTRERLEDLAARGLDHVQISIQDSDATNADRIAHYAGGHGKKREVARWTKALNLPLTLNAPIHRQNIASLPAIVELALDLGAGASRSRMCSTTAGRSRTGSP